MPRLCSSLLVSLVIACESASAATLTVNSDKTTYNVGKTITLTVTGDDEGDIPLSYAIYGRLVYSGALVDNGTRTQAGVMYGPGLCCWFKGSLEAGDDGIDAFSEAFDQVAITAVSANVVPVPLSTVTLIAQAIGILEVNWDMGDLAALDFFGLTSAPGTSVTIVPEPTTAALLVIGLLGLAGWRRGPA